MRSWILVVGAIAITFILAACSSSAQDVASTPTPTEASKPAPTEASTPVPTEASTPAPTELATESPSEPTETPAPTLEPTPTATIIPKAKPTQMVDEGTSNPNDPCSVLTEAEVEAAVGNPVVLQPYFGVFCRWASTGQDHSVILMVREDSSSTCSMGASNELRYNDVSTLGARAWWERTNLTVRTLTACPAGWNVKLSVQAGVLGDSFEATALRAGEELMSKVLQRVVVATY